MDAAPDDLLANLIWAFIPNAERVDAALEAARVGRVAGIWLLPVHMPGPEATALLVDRFVTVSPIPLLIGVDAEAGLGLVMDGATRLPSAMALGATGHEAYAREAGTVTGAEAWACGINVVAAPVLDVNSNPANPIINTRSFGASPDLVARMGLAFAQGLASERVLAIGKHVPGHGDTQQDSHLDLGTVNASRSRLDAVELAPFRAAIVADIPMLMTAHVVYPVLDPTPDVPATLSHAILTDLVRGELGYRGVVVTDAMDMFAIAHRHEAGEAAVLAVLAGADLVLTHEWETAYQALHMARASGRLDQTRIAEASSRVREACARVLGTHGRRETIDVTVASTIVGSPEFASIADRIAQSSITLADGALPGRPTLIVANDAPRPGDSPVEERLTAALTALGHDDTQVLVVGPNDKEDALTQARLTSGPLALLQFTTVQSYNPDGVAISPDLPLLGRELSAAGKAWVAASLGSPYVLDYFHGAAARLCAYDGSDASLRALLRVLMGETQPLGTLPVPLNSAGR